MGRIFPVDVFQTRIRNSNSTNDTGWNSWDDNIVGIDIDNNIDTCDGIQINISVNIYANNIVIPTTSTSITSTIATIAITNLDLKC